VILDTVTVVTEEPSVTLAIAIAALVVSLGGIAIQGFLNWLNGSRIRLELKWSMVGNSGVVTMPHPRPEEIDRMKKQGFSGIFLAVEVTNKGRGKTNIVGFSAMLNNGISFAPTAAGLPFNPTLPYHLEMHSQAVFHVPFEEVVRPAAVCTETGVAARDQYTARMQVVFGSGRKMLTKDQVPVKLGASRSRSW
jgi:hypothetical protein